MRTAAIATASKVFISLCITLVSSAGERFKYSTTGEASRCGKFARFCNRLGSISSNLHRVDTPESIVTVHALIFYEISARFNDENRCLHRGPQAARYQEVRHCIAAGTVAYLRPDLH